MYVDSSGIDLFATVSLYQSISSEYQPWPLTIEPHLCRVLLSVDQKDSQRDVFKREVHPNYTWTNTQVQIPEKKDCQQITGMYVR